jgi:hypothetical protein
VSTEGTKGDGMDWREAANEVRREIEAIEEALKAVKETVDYNPVEADVDAASELHIHAKALLKAMVELDEAEDGS